MALLWLTAGLYLSILIFGLISLVLAAVGVPSLHITVFRCITATMLCSLFIFKYTYSQGYKNAEYKFVQVFLPLLIVCLIQFALAYILRFVEYTSGGAYYLARLLYGKEVNADWDVPNAYYIVYMIIAEIFYIIGGVAGAYIGMKKRLRDKESLIINTN